MHWGQGAVVEEASATGEYHEPAIQLIRFDDGSLSIRFCYYSLDGRFQRSPLMLNENEIAGMHAALKDCPQLMELLRRLTESP
jgi:hypothetical protein